MYLFNVEKRCVCINNNHMFYYNMDYDNHYYHCIYINTHNYTSYYILLMYFIITIFKFYIKYIKYIK